MKLTTDRIRSITVGAIKVEELEDGVHFYRYTPRQTEAWFAQAERLGKRSLQTAAVRLDFETNSKHFAFEAARGDKFELLVDGVLQRQFVRREGDAPLRGEVELPLRTYPTGESCRISFYLPSHSTGILKSVELDDNAFVKPIEHEKKILFIGDSITQGWDSTFDTNSYAIRTTRFFDANSVVQGIGGAYYHEDTFDVIDYDPDTVIVAYGTNDAMFFPELEVMQGHVVAFLDKIKETYGGKSVYVISPIWRGDEEGNSMDESFVAKRRMIEREAAARGFTVLCGLQMVPPTPEHFADKYLHPNDVGFAAYAERLCKILQEG